MVKCDTCNKNFDSNRSLGSHKIVHCGDSLTKRNLKISQTKHGLYKNGKLKIWSKGLTKKENTSLEKSSLSKIGEKNVMWKGNKVKYGPLHSYIKRHKKREDICNKCKIEPSYDLANISGEYKRDIDDWEWLCRKCHMKKDGRLSDLILRNINNKGFVDISKLDIYHKNVLELSKQFKVGTKEIRYEVYKNKLYEKCKYCGNNFKDYHSFKRHIKKCSKTWGEKEK